MNYDLTFEEYLRKLNEAIENDDALPTFITDCKDLGQETNKNYSPEPFSLREAAMRNKNK